MSADGQTLTLSEGGTWTRSNHSIDGVWEMGAFQITVSGSTGVISALATPPGSVLWQDAINKNYVKVGDQFWKSLTSTGNLTWSGQALGVTYNTSNPNVATGTGWSNCTFTMSTDGQTLNITGGQTSTWTRKQ